MTEPINTHGYVMEFGRHSGELITRVPVSYLKWMINAEHRLAPYAQAELDRRGTTTPTFDISGHAIDQASLRIRKIWHESKNEGEGIHSWLCRVGKEALEHGEKHGDRIHYKGVKWVFETDGLWPVLKTVMR